MNVNAEICVCTYKNISVFAPKVPYPGNLLSPRQASASKPQREGPRVAPQPDVLTSDGVRARLLGLLQQRLPSPTHPVAAAPPPTDPSCSPEGPTAGRCASEVLY